MIALASPGTFTFWNLHLVEPSPCNIIAAPEGLEVVEKAHSDIDIFIAKIDEKLNEEKFIIPGLGDAGDRIYHTAVN